MKPNRVIFVVFLFVVGVLSSVGLLGKDSGKLDELSIVLDKTARYCQALRNAAFHFVRDETIVETIAKRRQNRGIPRQPLQRLPRGGFLLSKRVGSPLPLSMTPTTSASNETAYVSPPKPTSASPTRKNTWTNAPAPEERFALVRECPPNWIYAPISRPPTTTIIINSSPLKRAIRLLFILHEGHDEGGGSVCFLGEVDGGAGEGFGEIVFGDEGFALFFAFDCVEQAIKGSGGSGVCGFGDGGVCGGE